MASEKKKRNCPALERVIKRDECGRWRHTEVECTPDCGFNPFSPGNYLDQFLDTEAKVLELMEKTAVQSMQGKALAAFEKHLRKGEDLAVQARLLAGTQVEKDADGRNLPQRLLTDPRQRFKNDERILLQALSQTRPSFLEVRKILDDRLVEVIDHLAPAAGRFFICDRSLAARCCRFDTYCVWTYPLPHYRRVRGSVIVFTGMGPFDGWGVFCEIVRKLGGDPDTLAENPAWLVEHTLAIRQMQERVHAARQRSMLDNLDVWYCTGDYRSVSKADAKHLLKTLNKLPQVAQDPPEKDADDDFDETSRWTWLDESGLEKRIKPTWGVIRYNEFRRTWRIESGDSKRFQLLKTAFETAADGTLKATGEKRTNLAESLEKNVSPDIQTGDLPASLLQEVEALETGHFQIAGADLEDRSPARLMEIQFREFMKQSIPALGGKTLAEAAKVPELRPRALQILKGQINSLDLKNLESGTSADLQDLIESTGLTEAFEPPPPLRKPLNDPENNAPSFLPPQYDEDLPEIPEPENSVHSLLEQMDPEEREETLKRVKEMTDEAYRDRPICPRPKRRLNLDEVDARIGKGLKRFGGVEEILTEMNLGSGADLLQDLSELMEKKKIGKSYGIGAFCGISIAWLALVKPDHRVRRIAIEHVEWTLDSLIRKYEKSPLAEDLDELQDALEIDCKQPAAVFAALDGMMDYYEDQFDREFEGRPPKDILRACLIVRAFIDSVLHAMGTRP